MTDELEVSATREGLLLTNPRDQDNQLSIVRHPNGDVSFSVSEERAMDSYNQTFECSLTVPKAHVASIISWLTNPRRPVASRETPTK